jgi:hypothetical protein
VLAQLPTPIEVVAIALVIGGVALHQERLSAYADAGSRASHSRT